jgi:hypothetical protein
VPEIPVPIQPPASCRVEPPCSTWLLSALIPRAKRKARAKTMVERALAFAHQLAGAVVDRGDVVGVDGVPHAQRVGGDADADGERSGGPEAVAAGSDDHQQQEEAGDVEADDHRRHPGEAATLS